MSLIKFLNISYMHTKLELVVTYRTRDRKASSSMLSYDCFSFWMWLLCIHAITVRRSQKNRKTEYELSQGMIVT